MTEQTSLDERLQRLLEAEQCDLEMQQEVVKQIYKAMPQQIQRISNATGIVPDKVMQYANFVAFNNASVKFYDVIRIIRDFYMFKENDEKGMY